MACKLSWCSMPRCIHVWTLLKNSRIVLMASTRSIADERNWPRARCAIQLHVSPCIPLSTCTGPSEHTSLYEAPGPITCTIRRIPYPYSRVDPLWTVEQSQSSIRDKKAHADSAHQTQQQAILRAENQQGYVTTARLSESVMHSELQRHMGPLYLLIFNRHYIPSDLGPTYSITPVPRDMCKTGPITINIHLA